MENISSNLTADNRHNNIVSNSYCLRLFSADRPSVQFGTGGLSIFRLKKAEKLPHPLLKAYCLRRAEFLCGSGGVLLCYHHKSQP